MDYKIFDAHSDLPKRIYSDHKNWIKPPDNNLGKADMIKSSMKEGNIDSRIFSIYLDDAYVPEKSLHTALDILECTKKELGKCEDFNIVRNGSDLSEEKIDVIFGLEGSEPLKGNLNILDVFYELGVRTITLTHSRRNMVAEGSSLYKSKNIKQGGLSDFGTKLIRRMEEKNMIVDISHSSKRTFWDVIDLKTDQKIIASHSNSSSIEEHPRNLTDEQAKAIAESGGVIGAVCGIEKYVKSEEADINDFIDHISHLIDITSKDNVGLGMDFMYYLKGYESEIGIEDIEKDEKLENLVIKLQKRFSPKEVKNITYNNFERVIKNSL